MRIDARKLQSFMDMAAQTKVSAIRRSSRWIPCEERHPPKPMLVLALFGGSYRPGAEMVWYQGNGNWCGVNGPNDSPSHWQALPQPLASNERNIRELT